MGRMRGLVAALVVMAMAMAPARADEAADTAAAKQHFIKGRGLFDLEKYDEAVREFAAAYELRQDPTILYNLALAHQKAKHPREALHFYKAFVARAPESDFRTKAEQRIEQLEQEVASLPPETKPAPEVKPSEPAPPPEAKPAESKSQPPPAAIVSAPPPKKPLRTRLVAGAVVGAVGLGLTIGGIALSALSGNAANQLTNADRNHLAYDPKLYSTYQNDAVGGGVMLGIGVAALATGTALIVIDVKRHAKQGTYARN